MPKTITFLSIACGAFASIAATAILMPSGAEAAFSNADCWKHHAHCVKVCDGKSTGKDICFRTCDSGVMECTKAHPPAGSGGTRALPDPPKGRPIKPGVTIPGSRPGGGILETPSYGIPMQRPSSTGTRAPN
jgi:hypothetical protein